MPRYFFNIQDDTFIPDDKGEVLPDDVEARDAAEYLADQLTNEMEVGPKWHIIVTNAAGEIVARIPARTNH